MANLNAQRVRACIVDKAATILGWDTGNGIPHKNGSGNIQN